MYINYNVTHNDKDPKFKFGDRVRIPKYENIFAKGYTTNWSEEVFFIMKIKVLCYRHVLLVISNVKRLFGHSIKRPAENKPNRIQDQKSNQGKR